MEYEIKLTGTTAAVRKDTSLDAIAAGSWTETPMVTTYYRDEENMLGREKIMLRLRQEGNRQVVTCKAPSSLPHAREEYEVLSGSVEAAIPELLALGAPSILSRVQGLTPQCGARFLRQARLLRFGDALLELALDDGAVFREDRQQEIHLVEVELKEGAPEAAEALAALLQERYGLRPEPRSKLCMALEV